MSPQRYVSLWSVAGAVVSISVSAVIFVPSLARAAAHFLPDYNDHLAAFSSSVKLDFSNANSNVCNAFPLASCPKYGFCQTCPFGLSKALNSCALGYKKATDARSCVAKSCSEIETGYLASVASGYVCDKHLYTDFYCYSSCRAVSCSAYKISTCPANAYCLECSDCMDAETYKGNCSPAKLKVSSCRNPTTQKVNADATACIDKDDTCAAGYFKACDSGIDGNYTTLYTELGTACYKCRSRTCSSGGLNIDYYWCDGFLKCVLPGR